MIAATQEQQQQQQQQQQAAGTAPSAEEEALKRNTDCVYFLASPLTCKKGSECEYRHSEYARVNPRDCYFWLNGNCLNPKCGFRHPPLDGLFGTQVSAAAGSSLPPSNIAVPSAMHATQNTGKQAVQCIFFQKGLCLKGDRCAFLHGPNATSSNKAIATSSTEPPTPKKKPSAGPQKLTREQKTVQRNFSKAAEVPTEAKPVSKPEIVQPRNVLGVERNPPLSKSIDDELPMHKATNLAPVVNGNSIRFNRFQQTQLQEDHVFQNGKDSDEFLRESSPGFDVLVDDELRNSDYPHGEDQYRRRGHEGRNLNPGEEYDVGLSADYSSVADMDQETYHDLRGYDTYDHMQGHYAWEQHRASSERMLSGSALIERRGYSKLDSPESVDESDLRYRLSKHRRVNGLRSVVSHDFVSDNPVDEMGYRGSSRRDADNLSSHENASSGRLRGRIKLPGRSPNGSDPRAEREIDRGRNRARVSPGRSPVPSHQARIRDRVKARVEKDYINEGRHHRGARMRRELTDDRGTDFEGPKSLAELKGTKCMEDGQTQPSLRKRKQLEDHLSFEGDLSFKGPMPLSEILKRKREAEGATSGVMTSSRSKEDNHLKDSKESLIGSSNTVSETKDSHMSTKEESDKEVAKDEKLKSQIAGAVGITQENSEGVPIQHSSELRNPSETETEDGVMIDDGTEDREYEGDEQREGDYEYDQVDEGEYYEEGEENPEGEEEYVDEEDGEDFAKKIGVLFS